MPRIRVGKIQVHPWYIEQEIAQKKAVEQWKKILTYKKIRKI